MILKARYRDWIIHRPGFRAASESWSIDLAVLLAEADLQTHETTILRWPHKTLVYHAGQKETYPLAPGLRRAANRMYLRALAKNLGSVLAPLAYLLEVTVLLPQVSNHQRLTRLARLARAPS